jgi:hypothetical protein
MKRTPDPSSWRKKLDEDGIQYLEEYRRERQEFITSNKDGTTNLIDEVIKITNRTSKEPQEDESWIKFKDENPTAEKEVQEAVREMVRLSRFHR